jgi:hypothetical protein
MAKTMVTIVAVLWILALEKRIIFPSHGKAALASR